MTNKLIVAFGEQNEERMSTEPIKNLSSLSCGHEDLAPHYHEMRQGSNPG